MSENRITARARVQVTIEVDVSDTWGDDCTVRQVHDQAARSAESAIRGVLGSARFPSRIIGTPRVEMVTTGAAVITPPPKAGA